MSDYYYDDPVEEVSGTRRNFKGIISLILIIAVGGTYLQTTLAANIRLNSGIVVNFGQGVTTTAACSGGTSLTITPISSFVNVSGGGAFYFTSVKVANIPTSCIGKDFIINAYSNSSNSPLAIFNTSSTNAVVYDNAGTFELGDGTTVGASITSGSGTFTLTFTNPVATATSVFKLTIQSSDHVGAVSSTQIMYNVGDIGPGGGKVFYKDFDGFNCGATFSATGSPTNGKCYFLEVAPTNWSGGTDPDKPWATGVSSYYDFVDEDPQNPGQRMVGDRPGSGNASQDVTGLPNEDDYSVVFSPGLGYNKSLAIVAQGNGATTAAGAARAYRGGSKNDWYLPSAGEVNLLCQWSRGMSATGPSYCDGGTLNSQAGGGFAFSSDSYASSSARNADQYWSQKMDGTSVYVVDRKKSVTAKVRPIRAFGLTYELGGTGPGGGKIFYISTEGFSCGATYSATGSPTNGKCYYLEIAPSNWTGGGDPAKPWAISPYLTSDIGGIDNYDYDLSRNNSGDDGIGLGYRNSIRIVAQGNVSTSAAAAARAYSGGGKADWYLPTDTELNLVCQWAHGTTRQGNPNGSLNNGADCDVGSPLNSGAAAGAGLKTDKYYWSSTERSADSATLLDMGGQLEWGSLGGGAKNGQMYVRPIRAF